MKANSLICIMVWGFRQKAGLFIVALLCCVGTINGQLNSDNGFAYSAEGMAFGQRMVKGLTFRQQVAQTLMVPAWSREARAEETIDSIDYQKKLLYQIRDCGVGGIIFFQGSPLNQVYLTNYFQQESKIPLLVGIDGEWGVAMRMTQMEKYPFQMTLGATFNTQLAYKTGKSIGEQCKRMGIHINFAPSIDVNTEPNNPIIGFRSFGSDPYNVAIMGAALASGLQSAGVLASAKHFPGHGDTKTDSHKDLPVVNKSLAQLMKEDIAPFKYLIEKRVASIMVAHLKVLCIDSTGPYPTSISPRYVSQWLRRDLGFSGLIITDALNMKGVAKIAPAAELALLALMAGNDIILFPEDVIGFLDTAERAMFSGLIDSAEISERVVRLLAAKYDLKLFDNRFVDPIGLEEELTQIKNRYNQIYSQQVYDESMIFCSPEIGVVKKTPRSENQIDGCLKTGVDTDSLWVLVLGDSIPAALQNQISQYRNGWIGYKTLKWGSDSIQMEGVLLSTGNHECMIVGIDWPTWGLKSRGIPRPLATKIAQSNTAYRNAIYIHFGHQYGIQTLLPLNRTTPLILAHEYNLFSLRSAMRMAFGLAHHYSNCNSGLLNLNGNHPKTELDYAHGENQGYDPSLTAILDSLMREGLAREIFPSAQLVVLKNGLIAANLQIGSVKDMQGNAIATHQDHVYDLASIAKVASTTLAFMKIYETTKGINLDHSIGSYWANQAIRGSEIGQITFRELLTHQSGLPPFLPLQKMAISAGAKCVPCLNKHTADTISVDTITAGKSLTTAGENSIPCSFEITQGLCIDNRWIDSAWSWTLSVVPSKDKTYNYSDINLIILGKWIEYKTGKTLNEFVETQFYRPMGLKNMGYFPQRKGIALNRIAPTLIDSNWFRGEVRGTVHDPSALLFGGCAGNAGLFSNALDLAQLMYMLQERGHFEPTGSYLLKPNTVDLFTRIHNPKGRNGYRGLGFDKPNGKEGNKANVFEGAPASLFGHSGYTGTWAWSDPANGITFVFLSNRTYPTELNKKISQQGFRGQLLQAVYERLESVK